MLGQRQSPRSLRSSNWDCLQFSHHSSRRPSAERNARPSCRLHSQSVWLRLQEKRSAQKLRLTQRTAVAPAQRVRWCPESHTRRKARGATVIEMHRTKSRPSPQSELTRYLKGSASSFRGEIVPVAQRESPHNKPVDIRFGKAVFVPDELDRREAPSCQAIDGIVFSGDVYDYRAGVFTPQLPFRQVSVRTRKHQHHNDGRNSAENNQRKRFDCVLHGYPPYAGRKARAEVLTILLNWREALVTHAFILTE